MRSRYWWLLLGVAVILIALGAALDVLFMAIWGVACLGLWAYRGVIAPELAGRRRWRPDEEVQMVFSDAGVSRTSATASSTVVWTQFARLYCAGDVFLLRLRSRGFYIIPRRAFASEDDMTRFQELAHRSIPSRNLASR